MEICISKDFSERLVNLINNCLNVAEESIEDVEFNGISFTPYFSLDELGYQDFNTKEIGINTILEEDTDYVVVRTILHELAHHINVSRLVRDKHLKMEKSSHSDEIVLKTINGYNYEVHGDLWQGIANLLSEAYNNKFGLSVLVDKTSDSDKMYEKICEEKDVFVLKCEDCGRVLDWSRKEDGVSLGMAVAVCEELRNALGSSKCTKCGKSENIKLYINGRLATMEDIPE